MSEADKPLRWYSNLCNYTLACKVAPRRSDQAQKLSRRVFCCTRKRTYPNPLELPVPVPLGVVEDCCDAEFGAECVEKLQAVAAHPDRNEVCTSHHEAPAQCIGREALSAVNEVPFALCDSSLMVGTNRFGLIDASERRSRTLPVRRNFGASGEFPRRDSTKGCLNDLNGVILSVVENRARFGISLRTDRRIRRRLPVRAIRRFPIS